MPHSFLTPETFALLDKYHFSIIDNAQCGIGLVGKDGEFLYVNKKYAEVIEYTPAELMNKSFREITHPEDLDDDAEMVKAVLDGKIDSYKMTKRYISKTGKVVWVKLDVKGLYAGTERVLEVFLPQIVEINDPEVRETFNKLRDMITSYRTDLNAVIAEKQKNEERKIRIIIFVEKHWQKILILIGAIAAIVGGQGLETILKLIHLATGGAAGTLVP